MMAKLRLKMKNKIGTHTNIYEQTYRRKILKLKKTRYKLNGDALYKRLRTVSFNEMSKHI